MMRAYNTLTKSVMNAVGGIRRVAAERNMRIHMALFLVVTAAGVAVRLSVMEWVSVLVVSCGVMSAEAFNTALEILSDRVCPEYDRAIGHAKDAAAGAVLIWAVTAAVVGPVIFLPKIFAIIL